MSVRRREEAVHLGAAPRQAEDHNDDSRAAVVPENTVRMEELPIRAERHHSGAVEEGPPRAEEVAAAAVVGAEEEPQPSR